MQIFQIAQKSSESGPNTHGRLGTRNTTFFLGGGPYNIIDFHCISLFDLILYTSVNTSTAMK